MERIIFVIIVYVIWSFIKNLIKESTNTGSTNGKISTPPIVSNPNSYKKLIQEVYREPSLKSIHEKTNNSNTNSLEIDIENANVIVLEEENSKQINDCQERSANNEMIVADEEADYTFFDKENVLNGIIMAEIISPPKSRRSK